MCLCCFLPCQLKLVANDKEDFAVRIAAHGIQRVIAACLALENRKKNIKFTKFYIRIKIKLTVEYVCFTINMLEAEK